MKKEILIECLSLLPGGEGKIILDVKDIKPIETMEGTWEFTMIYKRHESEMSEISFHNIIKERTYKMVEKWIGFVKQAGIPKELHMDACVLATNIIETQTKIDVARLINTTVDYDTSLLVANFRVLSRIKDLNKIKFISSPLAPVYDYAKKEPAHASSRTYKETIYVEREELVMEVDPTSYLLDRVATAALTLIEKLSEEGIVCIYMPISEIQVIDEPVAGIQIHIYSRMAVLSKEKITLEDLDEN